MRLFKRNHSIKKRLNTLMVVCCLPFAVMIIYLLMLMNQFSTRYDGIVENITKANAYNINFKEELDYTMYIIVVNSERAEELVNTEEPYELIGKTRDVFTQLSETADSEESRGQLERIIRSLNTLESRVDEMIEDAKVSGNYDRNIERLDLNVRILTELVQEQIQEYIYEEASNLETVREGLRQDVVYAIELSVLCFLFILAGALGISKRLADSITEPLQSLCQVTKQAGSGDFAVRAEKLSGADELTELNESFNGMIKRIGDLVEDIRVEQLNLRVTELKLLQTQINPHFLYNTLDTILWLAEMNQTDQVITMVTMLSDFFRTSLSKGRDFITVREEKAHIRSYLGIQQFRYQDILDYEIAIDEELYDYEILKLSLQPLVENALYHGIKNRRGKGKITVRGQQEQGRLRFDVIDNGIGMTPERLAFMKKVVKGEAADTGTSSGFGLFNVAQRIQLNYGPEYGIEIASTYGEGSCISILIPAEKNKHSG